MAVQSLYRRYRPRTFGQVRGQDHVRHLAQGRGNVRLVLEHVECRPAERAGLQRLDQRRLVDDRAARHVDEDALRAECAQHLGGEGGDPQAA